MTYAARATAAAAVGRNAAGISRVAAAAAHKEEKTRYQQHECATSVTIHDPAPSAHYARATLVRVVYEDNPLTNAIAKAQRMPTSSYRAATTMNGYGESFL
jgi:hypothetical protein